MSGKGKFDSFDLEDPELPDWVDEGALTSGGYPYDNRMDKKAYKNQLYAAQVELVKLQAHLQNSGKRVVLVFEGRDSAGKGGAIERYTENLNHRFNRVVALPKPSDRELGQWYFQRYASHLPAAGETVLFDRSWYNRAGVEPVMGFCTPEQTRLFLDQAPRFEDMLVEDGIHLFKFWLEIGRTMQLKRFHARRHDPVKVWKLSPVDLKALDHWHDYTRARDAMFAATDTPHAPWTIVRGNDKRRARLGVIRTVLQALDYDGKSSKGIGEQDPLIIRDGATFQAEKREGE